jgi:vacuole morphology and inheritance protein 14
MSVKNGAELLDRLMKDIVAEAASNYVSIYSSSSSSNTDPHLPPSRSDGAATPTKRFSLLSVNEKDYKSSPKPSPSGESKPDGRDDAAGGGGDGVDKRAFSLARFIPLLSERVYVISPYTRMHLVSWLMVLDSVPDLELVAWLPEFLDGLL